MTKFLDAALEYADRGWKVFPLWPNTKKPIHDGGFHNGTTDATQIELWWNEHPNANIGLNLVASGLVAVDVDSYKKECEWEGFKGDRPFEPECIHRSARGGWHYIFKAEEGQTFSDPCSGVEIKHKGYIVLAPSTFEGKPYTWVQDDEPTPAPDWLPSTKESKPFEFGASKEKQSDKDLIDLIKTGRWIENIMRIVARYVQRGLHDDQIHAVTDLLTLKGYTVDDTRKDVQKLIDGARSKGWGVRPDKTDASAKINWMRLSDLAERPLKEREWTVDGWIPKGQVTLLYADGGVGKSQIVLQLLTSVALGENWFGLNTSSGSALYLGAEDDTDELHRRFHDVINARFKSCDDFPDVIFSSLAGEDALLADYDQKSNKLSPSSVMKELTAAIVEHKPTICVIDTLADVFPADENSRALARQFIGMLRKPAIEHKCALVVLAHPSLSGISTGRGTSGSTGWNNSVRSRITMERDDQSPDRRILKLAKSNYSKIGTEIRIAWENGVFVHDPHFSGLDAQAANSKARRVFLSLLEGHNGDGKNVNANGGSTHAPKVFAEHGMSENVTKKAFGVAMKSLLAEGVIKSEETKRGTRLVVIKR